MFKFFIMALLSLSLSLKSAAAETRKKAPLNQNQYYLYAKMIAEMLTQDTKELLDRNSEEEDPELPTEVINLLRNSSESASPTDSVIECLEGSYKTFLKENEEERTDESRAREVGQYRKRLISQLGLYRALACKQKTEQEGKNLLLESIIGLCAKESERQKQLRQNLILECSICKKPVTDGLFFPCTHYACKRCYENIDKEKVVKHCHECRQPIMKDPSPIITKKQIKANRLKKAKEERENVGNRRQTTTLARPAPDIIPVPPAPETNPDLSRTNAPTSLFSGFSTRPRLGRGSTVSTTLAANPLTSTVQTASTRNARARRTAVVAPGSASSFQSTTTDYSGSENVFFDEDGNLQV